MVQAMNERGIIQSPCLDIDSYHKLSRKIYTRKDVGRVEQKRQYERKSQVLNPISHNYFFSVKLFRGL